ncbi:MAG: RNA-binding protein [Candidatus Thermoplasmatota archaeon]|nr:RNA-binding protein [Candidatus Thermoplasmatota archaeon]
MMAKKSTGNGKSTLNLDKIAGRIQVELDKKDEARESVLSACRRIIRTSGNAIRTLHKGYDAENIKSAEAILNEASGDLLSLSNIRTTHPDLYYGGTVEQAMQEAVEARAILAIAAGKSLPNPDELCVTYSSYLLGLADVIGELRRMTLSEIRSKKFANAEKHFGMMEEIYDTLMQFDYPSAIVPIRQKQDAARGIIEKTMGELVMAMQRKDIEDKVTEFGGMLDEMEKPVKKKQKPAQKKESDDLDIDSVWKK